MRKITAVILLLVLAIGCVGCSLFTSYYFTDYLPDLTDEKTWEVKVSGAVIHNSKGDSVDIGYTDLEAIYLNLSGEQCDRKKKPAGENYEYKIVIKQTSGEDAVFYIYSDTDFYYDGYMYESLTGGIDLTFLSRYFD